MSSLDPDGDTPQSGPACIGTAETLNPKPQTPNYKLKNQHPKPQTPKTPKTNHKPQNSSAQTLTPRPQTSNHNPETLNAKHPSPGSRNPLLKRLKGTLLVRNWTLCCFHLEMVLSSRISRAGGTPYRVTSLIRNRPPP